MLNVLHIMAGADAGGISTVVLNYYRFMDRTQFHLDIAVTTDQIGQNAREFEQLGAKIYRIPLKSNGIKAYENAVSELLNNNHYDAIHVHENETSYVALRVAQKNGIEKRIAHAHSCSTSSSTKEKIKRITGTWLNCYYATKVIGCGLWAGKSIFGKRGINGKKGIVLPNAVDTRVFEYNEDIRNGVRDELQLADKYVVGMVGRLSYPKNHHFALELFYKYHEINPNAVLLLIGNGELEKDIKNEINERAMQGYVKMLGRRADVDKLYQAMDILILPSHYEGFPVTAVEAMAAGLPVLLSDKITPELNFGKAVRYIPLTSMEAWIDNIQAFTSGFNEINRKERCAEPSENGLDIRQTAKMLEKIYLGTI